MKAPIRNIIHMPQGLGIMEAAVCFRLSQLLKVSTVLVSQVLTLRQAGIQSEKSWLARLVIGIIGTGKVAAMKGALTLQRR